MKFIAVIPCYNEEQFIVDVVAGVMSVNAKFFGKVVVSDDGSSDETVSKAQKEGALVIQNFDNIHGAGVTTKRGVDEALLIQHDAIVTLDGDGQHDPEDIPLLLEALDDADIVIGSRFLSDNKVIKKYRKIGINIINLLYNIYSENKLTDSQCCFRVFKRGVLEDLKISEHGFAFSVETIIKARAKGYKFKEVPVKCIYHRQFSRNSSLNPVVHGLQVALAVVKWRVRLELVPYIKELLFRGFKFMVKPLIGHNLGKIRPLAELYKKTARAVIPEQSKVVDINGYKMRLHIERGRDIDGIAQNILFNNNYEPITTEEIKKLITENRYFVDVGANIGYFTLLAASMGCFVYAFEPEENNYNDLLYNIKLNDFINVYPVKRAVSDFYGIAKFHISESESGEHSLVDCRDFKKTIEVGVVRLDQYLSFNNTIEILKIDTEGNECEVLKGAEGLFNRGIISNVVLEFWPNGLRKAGHEPKEIWNIMKEHKFKRPLVIDEQGKRSNYVDYDTAMSWHSKHKFSLNLLFKRS